MKTRIFVLVAVIALVAMFPLRPVNAQAANGVIILLQVGTPASCTWPTGATVTNGMALCATTTGLYYSVNGSATFNPVAGAGGVSSFNGRTGAVTLTKADVTATGLAATTSASTTLQ